MSETTIPAPVVTCVPPVKFERNEFGLICGPTIEYIYKENGRVDWRQMVPRQFIVPNKQKTTITDTGKLTDKELLILLMGFREVADIRGFRSVSYLPVSSNPNHVIVSCQIEWIGNYETEGKTITSSGVGDASPENTSGFGKQYLGPIAENRSFIRAVRNFLKIDVCGYEEINPQADVQLEEVSEKAIQSIDPRTLLLEAMTEKGVTFDRVLSRLKEEGMDISNIASIKDLPEWKVIELRSRILKLKN